MSEAPQLSGRIARILAGGDPAPLCLETTLREVLTAFNSETGTLHRLDPQTATLHLVAHAGLPAALLPHVQTIPVGKGIAGQVAAENRPVTICNLQTDTSGVAQPAALQTGVGGALCVPLRHAGRLTGTLGIGTRREYDYTAAEINQLQDLATQIAASPCFA